MIIRRISIGTYIGLTVVFIASLGCAYFLPMNEILRNIATAPAVAALVAAIYQLLRDQASFERQDYLQRQQQIFNLGTTSHMANVAFDKHAEFCEKYMKEVHETVGDLFRLGPKSQKVNDHLTSLIELKKQHAAWVPKEIALQLEPFEYAIRDMSMQAELAKDFQNEPGDSRIKAIKAMYAIFHSVLNIEDKEITEKNEQIAVEEVKEKIRSILGINELTKMRKMLVSGAIRFLEDA
jgi:hypothetical protein